MSSDLVVPLLEQRSDFANLEYSIQLKSRQVSSFKQSSEVVRIGRPFYFGVVEPKWLERQNEMICSLIIQ